MASVIRNYKWFQVDRRTAQDVVLVPRMLRLLVYRDPLERVHVHGRNDSALVGLLAVRNEYRINQSPVSYLNVVIHRCRGIGKANEQSWRTQ